MTANECPYASGAELVLPLSTSENCEKLSNFHIRVRVIDVLALTNGQAMKVAIIAQPDGSSLPSMAFLKLYDRRFLRDRLEDEPWTHAGELKAQKVWARFREQVASSCDRVEKGGVPSNSDDKINSSDEDEWEQEHN